jgi:hypothetical protein
MAWDDTVRGAAAVETWSSLVRAALGVLGLALLAVGPLVPRDTAFHYLPQYTFVLGGALVLVSASMRMRSLLIVLGCVALTAALACTLAAGEDPDLNLAALALYSAAAVILGAAGRNLGMAVPFLLVPLLIVAPQGTADWAGSRDAFIETWEDAVGCPCLLAGLPAGMAVVGAAIGQMRQHQWRPVRPSAVPVLIASGGLLMASLVVGTLVPEQFAFVAVVCMRIAVIAAVLAWIALAYQVGRVAFVWQAAAACLFILAGALFLDPYTSLPEDLGPTLGITVAVSLMPAVLAGMGLLVRRWVGTERPAVPVKTAALKGWDEAEQRAFLVSATTAPLPKAPSVEPGPSQPEPGPQGSEETAGAPETADERRP